MTFCNAVVEILITTNDSNWTKKHPLSYWQNLLQKITQSVFEEEQIHTETEISILLTNDEEIHALNLAYRGKDKPTNVLSFPSLDKDDLNFLHKDQVYPIMLGDIALAFETIDNEATQEKKNFLDHFHHLVVHGMLHLLGYDHESDQEEEQMKQKEIKVLETLNINNPYQ